MIIYGYEELGSETTAYVESLDAALYEAKRYSNRVHFEVTVTKYRIRDDLTGRAFACFLLNGKWAAQSEEIRKFRHGKLVRKLPQRPTVKEQA